MFRLRVVTRLRTAATATGTVAAALARPVAARTVAAVRCRAIRSVELRRGLTTTSSAGRTAGGATVRTQPSAAVMSLPHTPLLDKYLSSLRSGKLRHDPRQDGAIEKLNQLFLQYTEYRREHPNGPPAAPAPAAAAPEPASSGFFGWGRKPAPVAAPVAAAAVNAPPPVRGLYLYGGVGSGKTMLMDMFYDQIDEPKKVRRHFHSFMLDIHARLHAIRLKDGTSSDPLPRVALEFVASEARLLCLDEFQVTDVADAMILQHLFGALFRNGCVVIATSNRNPDDLYKGGINRPVFMPFIGVLKQHCVVHAMETGQDHRLLGTLNEGVYHFPLNAASASSIARVFDTLSDHDSKTVGPRVLDVMMGRKLTVPRASRHAAWFTFRELCETALGAADYIALARAFPNLILTDIPVITFDQREKLRRFINLLDVLYEQHVRLIVSAAAPPNQLFQPATSATAHASAAADDDARREHESDRGIRNPQVVTSTAGKGLTHQKNTPTKAIPEGDLSSLTAAASIGVSNREDESFASSRAVSRLIEMQSIEYLERTEGKRATAHH